MSFWFDRRLRIVAAILATVLTIVLSLMLTYAATPAPAAKASPTQPFCGHVRRSARKPSNPGTTPDSIPATTSPRCCSTQPFQARATPTSINLTLPKDPPTLPKQDGTGGTWNFQLHPAFWFGMAMCDDQSAPLPGAACPADSDTNIFNSTNPNSAKYMGKHPGTGFMEMQFYPPGWDSFGCTQTQWCAALNIDSFSSNSSTGVTNNDACLNAAGEEYVNFAFITLDGKSQGPADPLRQTAATFTPGPDTLFFSSGDQLIGGHARYCGRVHGHYS